MTRGLMVVLVVVGAGCGGNDLHGSVGDSYRLGYDFVRARLYPGALSVEYVTERGAVPVRLAVATTEVDTGRYELPAEGDVTGMLDDGTTLPPLQSGHVRLQSFQPSDGARVAGSFRGLLDTGTDILSVAGEFDADLELVLEWPPPRAEGEAP